MHPKNKHIQNYTTKFNNIHNNTHKKKTKIYNENNNNNIKKKQISPPTQIYPTKYNKNKQTYKFKNGYSVVRLSCFLQIFSDPDSKIIVRFTDVLDLKKKKTCFSSYSVSVLL